VKTYKLMVRSCTLLGR